MNQFVVFMGGTGARIMKAFAYVLSAGVLDSNEKISILSMDSDKSNETGENSANQIMQEYTVRQERAQNESIRKRTRAFKTPVSLRRWEVQPTFLKNKGNATLLQLADGNPEAQGLMNLFYSDTEQEIVPETYGFVAHPNVGAALIYAAQLDSNDEQKEYGKFRREIATASGVGFTKVILVGSLFGGTGAASFPTMASDIRNYVAQNGKAENLQIGAVMMTPYFKIAPQEDMQENSTTRIDSEQFPAAAKRALGYYANQGGAGMDTIYLLGAPVLNVVKEKEAGGAQQKNPSMYPELEAAFAICHFLQSNSNVTNNKVWYKYIEREATENNNISKMVLKWDDLSVGMNGARSLASMTYFCLLYLYHLYPDYQGHVKQGGGFRAFMYCVDPVVQKEPGMSGILEELKKYCISYLEWANMTLFGMKLNDQQLQNNACQQMVNESVLIPLLEGVLDNPDDKKIEIGEKVFGELYTLGGGKLFDRTLSAHGKKYNDIRNQIKNYDLNNVNSMSPIIRFETFFHFVYSLCDFQA